MKKVLVVLALAAMLSVSLASVAQARGKVLSFKRAAAVTNAVAERDCARDAGCFDYFPANCRRQAVRRISCIAVNDGNRAGVNYQCQRVVLVRLVNRTGDIKYATGDRQCFATKK